MAFFSFSGVRPGNLGVHSGRLSSCPSSPNCVSTDADDQDHHISALELTLPPADGWRAARAAVARLPRTTIVTESADYLHAECGSAFFGFVDDLELHLRLDQNVIAVRSAARLGRSDFGVNRKRVESLRAQLKAQGVAR